jgi:hypothetical protein
LETCAKSKLGCEIRMLMLYRYSAMSAV